jgi:hypothetical protein
MSPSRLAHWSFVSWWVVASAISGTDVSGATIVAGPGEAGLRAALEAAQEGDTVVLTNAVQLHTAVVIDKRITLTVESVDAWRIWLEARFDGEMLNLSTNGIVLEGLRMYGSVQTDALRAEGTTVTLRNCIIADCRRPVLDSLGSATFRLERVTVSNNQEGLECQSLEAKDCTISGNRGGFGVVARVVDLDACVIESNHGLALSLINGNVKNCVFRYNTDFGLWFDPDNGYLNLKSCLFYANPGGGAYLGEGGYATVDNCTFTRHTGRPAVIVSTDAHDVFFRHCTVADNVVVQSEPWHWLSPPSAFWIGSRARLQNCLIADNPTDEDPHASGLVGYWSDEGGNVIGGPANLSTLSNHGGPTLSLVPLPGSPAIDAGQMSDIVSDAHGFSRLAGAAPDAGAVETDAAALADTDGDGLPDNWERFRRLNPNDPADAFSDSDGDGQSALAEFGSSTDPGDGQSVHRTESVVLSSTSSSQPYPRWGYLTWTRYPGVFYHVEASDDLRNWRRMPDAAMPGGSTLWWSLGLIEPSSPTTFYRVLAVK